MKAINFLSALMISLMLGVLNIHASAQNDEMEDLSKKIEAQQEGLDSIDMMMKDLDSISKSLDRMLEQTTEDLKKENMERFLEQNQRNLEAFMAEQNARQEQQRKRLWIRGGVLLVLVITMVVNFIRRRRSRQESA